MTPLRLLPLLAILSLLSHPARSIDPVLTPLEEEVDVAIDKALSWLASRQKPNGSFPGTHGESSGVVSLAGMAFLSKGHVPGSGPHGASLNRCVDWILTNQKANGRLNYFATDRGMYAHNISTLFLAEVSGMVDPGRQARIDRVLPQALAIILSAQRLGEKDHRHAGGWRYSPDAWDSDLSCSGWAIMALRSARLNGARIPKDSIDAAIEYILRNHDKHGGSFGYQDGSRYANTLTGTALLCLELTGHHDHPACERASKYILENHRSIASEKFAFYGVYYNAQAAFQRGGEVWKTYGWWMYQTWLPKQKPDGSWRHHEPKESDAYYTAMMVLSFTVPYRQLPIYQRETVSEEP